MAFSYLASPKATLDVLSRFGLSTKKSLGQHFLIDDNVIGRILALSGVGPDDVVLEVGPGIGTLTVALLPRARGVVAIERDRDLAPVLAETCAQDSDKFQLIVGDALKVDEGALANACRGFGRCAAGTGETSGDDEMRFGHVPGAHPSETGSGQGDLAGRALLPNAFVANLPYAVAATIVLCYLERFGSLETATVMVQSEVADRMAAVPGNKDYGAYTVKLRLVAEVADRFQVSAGCFLPPPHVDSAVVHLVRRPLLFEGVPVTPRLARAGACAADAAFMQRRKNLKNSVSAYLASRGISIGGEGAGQTASRLIAMSGIDPGVRGETLDVQDFLRLGEAMLELGLTPASDGDGNASRS